MRTVRPTAQAEVRGRNLAAVTALVRARGPMPRADVADLLGLNKSTVSGLVGELLESGLLEEGTPRGSGRPGRPSTDLRIGRSRHGAVVAELLPDVVRVSRWNLAEQQIGLRDLPIAAAALGPAAALTLLADALAEEAAALREAGRCPMGTVLAIPGVLDVRGGRVIASAPLGWCDIDLSDLLAAAPGPARPARPANLAALAEWRTAAPGHRDLICLHAGPAGLGAGFIVDGRPLTGARGRGGELAFPEQLPALPAPGADTGDARDALAAGLAARLAVLVPLLDPSAIVLSGALVDLTGPLRDRLDGDGGQPELIAGVRGHAAARHGAAAVLADAYLEHALTDTGPRPSDAVGSRTRS